MLRRCISLLLVVGLCATQLAAIPHAHAAQSASEQHEHESSPHFHCDWFSHHAADHELAKSGHTHRGRSHHHHVRPTSDDEPRPAVIAPPGDTASHGATRLGDTAGRPRVTDHDATAIDCPVSSMIAPTNTAVSSLTLLISLSTPGVDQSDLDIKSRHSKLQRARPPDQVLDDSNIYLTLRNLRI